MELGLKRQKPKCGAKGVHASALASSKQKDNFGPSFSQDFIVTVAGTRSSEFAHPDITIGLTLLSFRYEGLRMSDFDAVLDLLVRGSERAYILIPRPKP